MLDKMKVARGEIKAELVLKNGKIINVLNGQVEANDIAIEKGIIVGIGHYEGIEEVDLAGKYVCPGFIDGHVHIESSLLTPPQFAKMVMPLGTTTVIADPHEIANVVGVKGIEYMLKSSQTVPLDVYMMLPSCVPATDFETSGAKLMTEDLISLVNHPMVLGLGEVMNYPGVISGDIGIHSKLELMKHRMIDGHAPGVSGKELDAYITAGIRTDHECTTKEELLEKTGKGMYVHIREGSATRNLEALIEGVTPENSRRILFCTDDKQPMDILSEGHINHNVRKGIQLGIRPITAIQMATLNVAECYGLTDLGAIAPGYRGDLLVLKDLESVDVEMVYKDGVKIAEDGKALFKAEIIEESSVYNTVKIKEINERSLELKLDNGFAKVIGLIPKSILTHNYTRKVEMEKGVFKHHPKLDILKLSVIERHHLTGNVGLGLVEGYGLKHGAIGLTIAHDSHNIIVIGDNDTDMLGVVNQLTEMAGGIVICQDGKVLGKLALEVGGIMTNNPYEDVVESMKAIGKIARQLGVSEGIEPFLTLAFLALPVIPTLKLTDKGLFDVTKFDFVDIND